MMRKKEYNMQICTILQLNCTIVQVILFCINYTFRNSFALTNYRIPVTNQWMRV